KKGALCLFFQNRSDPTDARNASLLLANAVLRYGVRCRPESRRIEIKTVDCLKKQSTGMLPFKLQRYVNLFYAHRLKEGIDLHHCPSADLRWMDLLARLSSRNVH